MTRAYFQVTLACVVAIQSGCAWNDEIKGSHDQPTRNLAQSIGYPACELSSPLQIDDVIRHARENGIRLDDPNDLRQQLSESVKAGYEIRLIDCTKDVRGLAVGTEFFAAIKDGRIGREWLREINN